MPKIDIAKLPIDTRTGYPEPFDRVVVGRERKRLGNAVGLDQFGVNLTTLKPGAASALRHWHEKEDEFVYMLEGEVVLIEDDGEMRAQAGRRRRLQGRQPQRPSAGQPQQPRRGLSRDRHALEARTRRISGHRHDGGARRSGHALHPQERRTLCAESEDDLHQFQARHRRRRHRARHLERAGAHDECHRCRGDRGTVGDRRGAGDRWRRQGRRHHLGQGHLLRRRRSHAAWKA